MLHTVRVENTRNTDINTVLTVESIGQRFGNPFALIVACTRTDRVDVAPAGKLVRDRTKKG